MKPLTKEIVSPQNPSVKRMSEEAQQIAIAEACPNIIRENLGRWEWFDGLLWRQCVSNSLLHDLNAMAEAEELLHKSFEDSSAYEHFLRNVVYKTKHSGVGIGFATLNATAPQRAEAFLRTKGKWNDSI